ncbi:MAG: hypothetical protein HeimC2_18930 [Candidatus Heimdallarchaeota archaeon LC_2]|nr:MAG: hypothetical protein HeimC2_18930 [Candidatus Heimdallarchaeota archaeon LC_2]
MSLRRKYRKGQLFLMEVIISLTVLFALITILFSNQQLTPPPVTNNLDEVSNNILNLLSEDEDLFKYLTNANYSFYTLGSSLFDSNNATKVSIFNTIKSGIPILSNFKTFIFRFNPSTPSWDQIDIINFEAYTPSGSDITQSELYIPGFQGLYDQYRIQLSIWYEVQ